jgi:MFS family permease
MSVVEPLRHKPFRWLVTGRTTGWLANAMAPIALAFAVLDLTGSVTDLGIVVGARSITNVLLLLIGGVLADRMPRALLLQGASVAAALSAAFLATAVLLGFASIPLLVVLGMINGAVAAVSLPAAAALTPQTVPASALQQANAVARMAQNLSIIAGASLGGFLAAVAGPGWAIAVTALLFGAEAAGYTRVRGISGRAPRASSRPLADLREGWHEFSSRTWLWVIAIQFMLVNAAFSGTQNVLGPKIADDTFGRTGWGLMLAAQTLGALAGGLLAAHWLPRRALGFGTALVTVMALPPLTLGVAPRLSLLLVAMLLAGIAVELFAVAWDLSLQQEVPPDRLARVYSYDATGSFVAIPAGQLTAGPIANHVGTGPTLVGGACVIVLATAAALLSRSVRALRRQTGRLDLGSLATTES